MERLKYISLVAELRQIAVRRALALLDEKEEAEDVAGEVLLRLWEKHEGLRDNADEVRRLADTMARNFSLDLLRHRRRHPVLRIFHRQGDEDEETTNTPDIPDSFTPQHYIEEKEAGCILTISVDVKNTGSRAGKEAVLLYSSDLVASIVPDNRRLRDFTKVELQPGETKTVTFQLPAKALAFVGADGRWTLEEGDFILKVGDQTVPTACSETKIWDQSNI